MVLAGFQQYVELMPSFIRAFAGAVSLPERQLRLATLPELRCGCLRECIRMRRRWEP